MTELLTRPPRAQARSTVARAEREASLWWRGALAAVWAVSLGVAVLVVVVLIVWATDSRSGAGAGEAIRGAMQLWLVAHKVPLHVQHGVLAVAPLGLTALLAALVARAAAVLGRGHGVDCPSGVALVALAIGIPYGVLTAFVAAAATSNAVRPSPLAALAAGLILGCAAAACGATRAAGGFGPVMAAMPDAARVPAAAAARALIVLLGSGLLLSAIAVARNVGAAADAARLLGGGIVAGAGLFVLDFLLMPNAAVAAIGYVSGPGFAVGTGSSVTLASVHLGAMPSLPLLAAVPRTSASPTAWAASFLVLVAAGAIAGWRIGRDADATWWQLAGRAVSSAALAGIGVAILAALAGGPGGPGRMTAVGASPWQVGLAVAGEVAVAAVLVAMPARWSRR